MCVCVCVCVDAPQVAEHTTNKQRMDEFSMVYYNNLLSLPCIFGLMVAFGELGTLGSQPALGNPLFLFVAGLGGLVGFAISFSSLWFLSQVRATVSVCVNVCVCVRAPPLCALAADK